MASFLWRVSEIVLRTEKKNRKTNLTNCQPAAIVAQIENDPHSVIKNFSFLKSFMKKLFNPTRLACPLLIFPNPDRDKYKNVQFKFDRDNIFVENLNHYTLEETKPDMIVEHTCEKYLLTNSLSLMPRKIAESESQNISEADDDGFHVHN